MKYIILLIFCTIQTSAKALIINELCPSNQDIITDSQGDTPDWIELYNNQSQPVNLLNYKIADDNNTYTFTEKIIEPGAFLLLFASDKNEIINGEIHLNFTLSRDGETLSLFSSENTLIDQIIFPTSEENYSYGRSTDAAELWTFFSSPTPNVSNAEGEILQTLDTQISIEKTSGFYSDAFIINIQNDDPQSKIYYTTDGSEPDTTDLFYPPNTEINIMDGTADSIAFINTSDEWVSPEGALQTAFVLRAAAFKNGRRDSEILHRTYFIHPDGAARYTLPVISIQTENDGLFNPEYGIYVKGNNENYWRRGRENERVVTVDFFDTAGELLLSQAAGLRLGGAKTRIKPQKTMRLYARSEYGDNRFRYPFWGEDYAENVKQITLRTMNLGPWSKFGFTDDLVHEIIEGETETDQVHRRFAIVFINGVYWGIHSFREHNDEHFLARKYNLDDDEIVKAGGGEAQNDSENEYFKLYRDIENMDLTQATDFQNVASRLELTGFTDYIVTNLAVANRDWPANNTEFWTSTALDNKIRFIMNDLDAAMTVYNDERLSLYFAAESAFLGRERWTWALIFLQKLLENDDYRLTFKTRMTELLTTTFNPARTVPILTKMQNELSPEIEEHVRRWHFPKSKKEWNKGADWLAQFLLKRPNFLLEQSIDKLGFVATFVPNPVQNTGRIDFGYAAQFERKITVLDALGKVVIAPISLTPETDFYELEMGDLADGIYFLRLDSDGILNTLRIVKQTK